MEFSQKKIFMCVVITALSMSGSVSQAQSSEKIPGTLVGSEDSHLVAQELSFANLKTTRFDYVTQYQDSLTLKKTPLTARAFLVHTDKAWSGEGERPLVAIAPGTQGTAEYCDPSASNQKPVTIKLTEKDFAVPYEVPHIYSLLNKGADVLVIDYPKTLNGAQMYVNNFTSARALLDAVRASFTLGVDRNAPVGLWGYSQGGGAAGAAAEIAQSYAPEINVKAANVGGPPSDLSMVLSIVDGTGLTGVIAYAAKAIMELHPHARELVWDNLSDEGRYQIEEGFVRCVPTTLLKSLVTDTTTWTTTGQTISELFLSQPEIRTILDNHKLGSVAPNMPVNLYSSPHDDIIPFEQVAELDAQWKARGGDILFREINFPAIPGGLAINHLLPLYSEISTGADWMIEQLSK